MPRVTKSYLAQVNDLPWPVVLEGLGLHAPAHSPDSGGFMMRCRRNDRTASLRFDHRGFFHCFSCGGSGDVFGFVLRFLATGGKHHTYGFPEAVHDPFARPTASVLQPRAYSNAIRHLNRAHGIGARKAGSEASRTVG